MTVAVGARLGAFEIVSLLGAGGMGEVYRARDTRLGREVAIKVLPTAFSANPDRLRRFEQEAQAAGMLSHPNILTIFEIGTHEGSPYIVSELLAGEELRAHLRDGPLPVRRILDYAEQVTCGLAAAHDKGITHRDLKPENLFITSDGRIKILDFGLAKLTQPKPGGAESATAMAQTDPGVVLGSVGYMSPEQVRGEEADYRADIFSFGVILYEMLAGKRAFAGTSAAQTMSAILRDEPPDLAELNDKIPVGLERVVRRCLEKKPEGRFQSTRDLSFALEGLSTPSGSRLAPVGATPATADRSRLAGRPTLAWLTAAVLLLGFLGLLPFAMANLRQRSVNEPTVRASILPPEKVSFNFVGTATGSIAISPDGRRLAFVATTPEGKSLLWVRSLDALSAQALAGTEGAIFPFWSPDGRSLGFFADGKLKRIESAGGPAIPLSNAALARGGTWNQNGVIIFAPDSAGALQQVSASGGVATPVTQVDATRGELTDRWPCFLPDGQHFLYLRRGITGSESDAAIYIGSLTSKNGTLLLRATSNVAYAKGHLLFLRAGTLMAQAFDVKRLEVLGEAFPVAEAVQSDPSMARGIFAASENGVLAYQTGTVSVGSQLVWLDRTGKHLTVLGDRAIYDAPRLSSDGKRVTVTVVESQTGNQDVWLYEVARGLGIRLTVDPADERFPMWSPDGRRVVFSSNRKGHFDLYQKASSGVGSDELLLHSDLDKYPLSWSPDGQVLLYYVVDPKTKADLWTVSVTAGRAPVPFLQTEFNESGGQFSPDGRWIVYASDESRAYEIYVTPFPGPGGRQKISTAGGREPKWRGDGKAIFYVAPDNKLMAADVNGQGASMVAGAVRPLFELHEYEQRGYDVTPDGQRFLFNLAAEQKPASPITLVLNWTADVKR